MIADGTAAEISEKWFDADILLKDAGIFGGERGPCGDTSLEDLKSRGELILGLSTLPAYGLPGEENNVVGFVSTWPPRSASGWVWN